MSSHPCLELQQSVRPSQSRHAVGAAAGCWHLAAGQPLSLHPQIPGVLQVARGRAWLTLRGSGGNLPEAAADHVLRVSAWPSLAASMSWWKPGTRPAVPMRWNCAGRA